MIDPQKAPCTANGSCFTDSRTENRQEDWSWRDSGTPTQTPDNRRDDSVRSAYAQEQEARNNTGYSSRESWFNHSDRPYRAPTDLGDLTRGIGKFRELQAQYNGIKGMGTAELAEMGRTAGNGFGSAAERWGNLTAKLPEDIRGFAAHTGLYAEYQSRRLWDYEKQTADKAGRDVSKSLQGMFAPSNPYRSWGGNTAKRASAALYGVQAYGNYLGEATGLSHLYQAADNWTGNTVSGGINGTLSSLDSYLSEQAGSDLNKRAYAGLLTDSTELLFDQVSLGKSKAKAAKGRHGKAHAEQNGSHADSGNPAQAYARSAGRYADNIPRGGVSHDFADAYRYRQTGGKSAMQLHKEAEALADAHYERIRNSKDDVAKIAANTGIKPHNIQKVKDHVFYNEHWLNDGTTHAPVYKKGRFHSDLDQANAWNRLTSGTHTPEDITWMKHGAAVKMV